MLNFSSLNLVEPGAQDEFTVFSAGGRFKQPVFYERFDMTLEPVRRQLRRFDDALKAQALGKKQGPQDHQALNRNSFVDLLLILKNEFEKLNIGFALWEKDAHAFDARFRVVRTGVPVNQVSSKNAVNAAPRALGQSQTAVLVSFLFRCDCRRGHT